MKIQDIFNLPNNRGGAKLFQRIMNRYGIPKEDSKELKNNIDNSSSGGGSSGEYYLINKDLISQYISTELCVAEFFIIYNLLIKATPKDKKLITTSYGLSSYLPENVKLSDIVAVKTGKLATDGTIVTFKELIEMGGFDVTNFDKAFPRITEEEFYDLNKWSLEDYK